MQINEMTFKILLTQPVYNPETGAYNTTAHLSEGSMRFTYRVSHASAPQADFEVVTRGLKAKALLQHGQAQERTRRFIRETVRAVNARANSPAVGAFLAA